MTKQVLSRCLLRNTSIIVGLIGKQNLPLFVTIFSLFADLSVTSFSRLPFPPSYATSTFQMWKQFCDNQIGQNTYWQKAFACIAKMFQELSYPMQSLRKRT